MLETCILPTKEIFYNTVVSLSIVNYYTTATECVFKFLPFLSFQKRIKVLGLRYLFRPFMWGWKTITKRYFYTFSFQGSRMFLGYFHCSIGAPSFEVLLRVTFIRFFLNYACTIPNFKTSVLACSQSYHGAPISKLLQ